MNRHSVLSCNLYAVSKQEEMSSLTYKSIHLRKGLVCKAWRILQGKIVPREMTHQSLSQISVICLGAY